MLRNVALIGLGALTCAALGAAFTLLRTRQYIATVVFAPSGGNRGNLAAMSGLASQLGFPLELSTNAGDGLGFYSALVKSRTVLGRLSASKYTVQEADYSERSMELSELIGVTATAPAARRRLTHERLARMITVRSQAAANVISVDVTSSRPELSEQLASGILEQVNEFNVERRQRQAMAERTFAQQRVTAQTTMLEQAETALAEFSRRNRSYSNSPELTIDHDRLQRRVDLEQQVLTSLLQNLERARVEEVRNTPVVTPIDLAVGSAMPKPRGVVLAVAIGLLIGAAIGLTFAVARESLMAARVAAPSEYAAMIALLRQRWLYGRSSKRN